MLIIRTPAIVSDGTFVITKNSGGNRNIKFGNDGSFIFCMGDFANGVSTNAWTSNQLSINWNTVNMGIGTVNSG